MALETLSEEAANENVKSLDPCLSKEISTIQINEVRYRRNSETQETIKDVNGKIQAITSSQEPRASIEDTTKIRDVTLQSTRDVHFGNTVFTAPITVVNHIKSNTTDGDDLEQAIVRKCSSTVAITSSSRSSVSHGSKGGFSGKHIWFGLSIATFAIMTIIIAIIMIVWQPHDPQPNFELPTTTEVPEDKFHPNETWFVGRSEWYARTPKEKRHLGIPVPFVVIGHTGRKKCKTKWMCCMELRKIQEYHMIINRRSDIKYNFMISTNGLVFEGRGANIKSGHIVGLDALSIYIGLLGNYDKEKPSKEMVEAAKELLADLVEQKKLIANFKIIPDRYTKPVRDFIEKLKAILRSGKFIRYLR